MKIYRCTCSFFYEENDGNKDIRVFVLVGQVFFVESGRALPDNWFGKTNSHFQYLGQWGFPIPKQDI